MGLYGCYGCYGCASVVVLYGPCADLNAKALNPTAAAAARVIVPTKTIEIRLDKLNDV
jgi:hypothetical protein